METHLSNIREYIYDRADNYCNQKYGDNLPYSFHLKAVEEQGKKFKHLIDSGDWKVVFAGLINHENIEDFRMTYNDTKEICNYYYKDENVAKAIADIVYCVTDEKGKTRKERKNDKYYKELSENKLAVFVKLADISANTLYSKLMNSSMYNKYKSEFAGFKEKCYVEEYEEFFNYLENL